MSDPRRARSTGGNLDRASHSTCVADAHLAFFNTNNIHFEQRLVSRTVSRRRVEHAMGKTINCNDNTVDGARGYVVGSAICGHVGRKAVLSFSSL